MSRRPLGESDAPWLDDGEPEEVRTTEHLARSRSWVPLALLAVIGLVGLTVTLIAEPAPQPAPPVPPALAEADDPRLAQLADAARPNRVTVQGEVNALRAEVVDALRGLADLDVALRAVVTSAGGNEARLVSVNASGDVLVAPLPQSADFRFDSSGEWLAGVSFTRNGEQRQVLWAGRVGSLPEPIAVGIGSYTWHDTAPGLLAWSEGDGRSISTLALDEQTDSLDTVEVPVRGRIEGWGDWGFALLTSGFRFTTAVLDADANVLDGDLPGRFSGSLPTGELLLTGGTETPVAFDPASSGRRSIPWLGDRDYVWTSSRTSPADASVVLVGRRGLRADPFQGEITRVSSDESAQILAETVAFTELAWSADRDVVVYAEQQSALPGSTGRLWAIGGDGRVDAVQVPDLFRGREWVAALAVR